MLNEKKVLTKIEQLCINYWGGAPVKGKSRLWADKKPDQAYARFIQMYKEAGNERWVPHIEHFWNHYRTLYGESKLLKRQRTT